MNAKIVQSPADLPDLKAWGTVVIDTETSGLSPHHGHRICGIALCSVADPGAAFYLPVRHSSLESVSSGSAGSGALPGPDQVQPGSPPAPYRNLSPSLIFPWLAEYASDPEISWVMHNAVFDLGMFRADGVEFAGRVEDTMVLAHGHDSHKPSYALDFLTPGEHPRYETLKAELQRSQRWHGLTGPTGQTRPAEKEYSLLGIQMLGEYACEDVATTARLYQRLQEKAVAKAVHVLPENFGNPSHSQAEMLEADQALVRVLFEMQWAGVKIDLRAVLAARKDAEDSCERAYAIMEEASGGEPFNPSSNRELSAAFERAGGRVVIFMLPEEQRGKQKGAQFTLKKEESTGKPCWNAAALLRYLGHYRKQPDAKAYKFLVAYRGYSQLRRLISTYLDAYLNGADRNGILHGSFNPTGTRTGRLSSRNPNLQNVTKVEENADAKALDDVLDQELLSSGGRAENWRMIRFYRRSPVKPVAAKDLATRIRSFFVARPGRWIVSIDYSSIEYRVAAYLTGDPVLIKAYRDNPDLDFHQHCADLIGITRSQAKTCVTGDSLVKTGQGLLRIDEIVKHMPGTHKLRSQFVYCEDGQVREAVSGISMGEKEVLELTTEWGIKLKLTPDHECMAVRSGEIVRVRADSLEQGDNVIIQHGAECHGDNRELPSLQGEKYRARTSHKALTMTELTPELCAWLGHFVAEGHRRRGRTSYAVGSAINPKQDADVLAYLKDLHVHLFKDRARVLAYADVVHFRVSSKDLYYLLEELGVGSNSATQVIPRCIRSASFAHKRAFFRAYFEGDGTVKGNAVSCTSKSEELIRQIQAEMLNIGIVGGVSSECRKGYGFFWAWSIQNQEMLRRFEERIGFIGQRKRHKLLVAVRRKMRSERACIFYDGFEKCYPGMSDQLHGQARDKLMECRRSDIRLGTTRLRHVPVDRWPASLTQLVQANMSTVKVLSVKKCHKKEPVYDIYEPVKTSMICNGLLVADCNFGTLYGMGNESLAGLLRIPVSQAESIRTRLYAKIPEMKRLINKMKDVGQANGQIQNPFGRVCAIDPERGYTALNYYDQGCCGDIMRKALVRVAGLIRDRAWDVVMMLTVHDEIVFDIPTELVSVAAPELAACMCDVPEIGLPLTCDIEVGRNWGEMVALEDWEKGA